jgi:hypothetical protein
LKTWARLLSVLCLVGVGVPALFLAGPVAAAPAHATISNFNFSICQGGFNQSQNGNDISWACQIHPSTSTLTGVASDAGVYRFALQASEFTTGVTEAAGGSLTVNGSLLPWGVDGGGNGAPSFVSIPVTLAAGQSVNVQVGMVTGQGQFTLSYQYTLTPTATPSPVPPTATVTPGGATATVVASATPIPSGYDCGSVSFPLLNCNFIGGGLADSSNPPQWSNGLNSGGGHESACIPSSTLGVSGALDGGFYNDQFGANRLCVQNVIAGATGTLNIRWQSVNVLSVSDIRLTLNAGTSFTQIISGSCATISSVAPYCSASLGSVVAGTSYPFELYMVTGNNATHEARLFIDSLFVSSSSSTPTLTPVATSTSTVVSTATPTVPATPTGLPFGGQLSPTAVPTATACPVPTAGGGVSTEILDPCLPLTRAIVDCGNIICECLHYVGDTIAGQLHTLDQDVVSALGEDLSASFLHPASVGSILLVGFTGIGATLGSLDTEAAGVLADETAMAAAEAGQAASMAASCEQPLVQEVDPGCSDGTISNFGDIWVAVVPQHLSTDLVPAEQSISDHMVGFSGALDGLIPFETSASTAPSFSARLFAGGGVTHVSLAAGFFSGAGLLTKFRAVCSFMLIVAWLVWVSRWFRRLVE